MRCCTLARPKLRTPASGGAIVNTASMLSFLGGGLVPGYSASKGGVAQLTKSLAIAYAADGIRVNAIAPGWVQTALTQALQDDPQRSAAILARTPLGAGPSRRTSPARPCSCVRLPRASSPAPSCRSTAAISRTSVEIVLRGRARCRSAPRFVICKKGDWQKAHAIVQNDESELGCWAHGIVHMLEGDVANARYWYRRAHRASRATTTPTDEIAALVARDQGTRRA